MRARVNLARAFYGPRTHMTHHSARAWVLAPQLSHLAFSRSDARGAGVIWGSDWGNVGEGVRGIASVRGRACSVAWGTLGAGGRQTLGVGQGDSNPRGLYVEVQRSDVLTIRTQTRRQLYP